MIAKVEPAVDEIREIYDTNGLVLARTKGLGLLPKEDAVRLGVWARWRAVRRCHRACARFSLRRLSRTEL